MPNTIADNLQRLVTAKQNIAAAITNKGGTVGANDGLEEFSADIASIPSGGGGSSGKTVKFIDYDGSVLHSYTKEEFLELEALPENPTHTGLTAQGWNWALAAAKTYVTNNDYLDIGQMYNTSDSTTKVHVSLPEGRTSPTVGVDVSGKGEVELDLGDGSEKVILSNTGTSYSTKKYTHEYLTYGDYDIIIKSNTGDLRISGSSSYGSYLVNYTSPSSTTPRYGSYIKTVNIGNGVKVQDSAFYNCYSITSVTIPSSVTSIGNSAFYSCYSLKSVTIPNSVTSIGNSAFYYCYSITSVTIPNSVTSIGNSAFYYCASLSSVTIPSSVTEIGNSVFYSCYSLSSITIPNSVTSIGGSAFYNCYSLSSVTIPSSVTSIGSQAFYNCSSLSSVTIPNSVTSIGNSAFYSCYSLKSVTIPNSVTSIGSQAFYSCYSLTSITIPSSVTSIGSQAFYNCDSLTSITIPSSVTSIESGVFYYCYSLSTVTIPSSVTSIGSSAFYYCYSLSSVTIPSSVTSIGNSAFFNCYSLSSVTIPSSVTSIGTSVFYNCAYIESCRFERATPPPVAASNTFQGWKATITKIFCPAESLAAYKSETNYPNPSTFNYIGFATYENGESLPTQTQDQLYNYTWYATVDDWVNKTNAITIGNGNEIYADITAV